MTAAAVAMLSACESLAPQAVVEQEASSEEKVTFTASLGADTKTYLEYRDGVYKNLWAPEDEICILDPVGGYYEWSTISSGAGTTTASFDGNLVADSYFAIYGPIWDVFYNDAGEVEVMPYIYPDQWMDYRDIDNDGEWEAVHGGDRFPMFAASDTTEFAFKNLCSILKFNIKGNGEFVKTITFEPNDSTMMVSGPATLDYSSDVPVMTMCNEPEANYPYIVLEVYENIEGENEYSIVLPSGTYKGGFTLTVLTDTGYMDVTTTSDIVFERSQIRSIPTITYTEEYTIENWGICGTMTEWSWDYEMEYDGRYYVYDDLLLSYGDEFKFRRDGAWDVIYGIAENAAMQTNAAISLASNGANFVSDFYGFFDIYLDPVNSVVYVMSDYCHPDDLPADYVVCNDYASIAALEDNTVVKVNGYVFATYGRGFIMNVGYYYENTILVYQGTDQSLYYPVLGNNVDMYATKTTYNGLPELKDMKFVYVFDDSEEDYVNGYLEPEDISAPAVFEAYTSEGYDFIRYTGTLVQSGNYYNIEVDGVTTRFGSLSTPNVDLSYYIGRKVTVEGFFAGLSGSGKYLNTILKNLYLVNADGSTEDVIEGGDIPVSSPLRTK